MALMTEPRRRGTPLPERLRIIRSNEHSLCLPRRQRVQAGTATGPRSIEMIDPCAENSAADECAGLRHASYKGCALQAAVFDMAERDA